MKKLYKRVLFLSAVLITTLGLSACGQTPDAKAETPKTATVQAGGVVNISNAELQRLLDQGVPLVDIRLPEEWSETGVVANSHKITLFDARGNVNPNFLAEVQKIAPKDKPIALICRTGNRTRAGSQMLVQSGYKQVYNVTTGIKSWIGEGRAVTR